MRQVGLELGVTQRYASKLLQGHIRSISESLTLGFKTGFHTVYKHTEETKRHLSEKTYNTVLHTQKVWTRPEQDFRLILEVLNIGVCFPEVIKQRFQLEDDLNPQVYFQYPIGYYSIDFADPVKKIAFHVNGDFYHANSAKYQEPNLTDVQRKNIKRDQVVRTYLDKQGWQSIDIWESELKDNPVLVKHKIEAAYDQRDSIAVAYEETEWNRRPSVLWERRPRRPTKVEKACIQCGKTMMLSASSAKVRQCCSQKCLDVRRGILRVEFDRLKQLSDKYGTDYNSIAQELGTIRRIIVKMLTKKGLRLPNCSKKSTSSTVI